MKKNGFTLIELMIVIAIIALLAAVALPKFAGATDDAKIATVRANLSNLRTAISMQYAKTGAYPIAGATGLTNASNAVGTTLLNYYSKPTLPDTPAFVNAGNSYAASGVAIVGNAPAFVDNGGWWYNTANGEVHPDLPNALIWGQTINWHVE